MFSTKELQKNEFIVEYAGNLISKKEGEELEDNVYSDEDGSFLYFFDKYW